MQINITTWSVRDLIGKKQVSLPKFPAFAKKLGMDGVELNDLYFPTFDKSFLDEIIWEAKANRMNIVLAIDNDFTAQDSGKLVQSILHAAQMIEAAQYLGSPVMRIFSGSSDTSSKGEEQVVAAVKSLIPLARHLGIRMCMENHWGISSQPERLLRVVAAVNSPFFGTNPDFGNFEKGTDKSAALKMIVPKAFNVHAKSYDFDEHGEETDISYKECIGALKAVGYDGTIGIEYEGDGEQIEGTAKTKELIQRYWFQVPS